MDVAMEMHCQSIWFAFNIEWNFLSPFFPWFNLIIFSVWNILLPPHRCHCLVLFHPVFIIDIIDILYSFLPGLLIPNISNSNYLGYISCLFLFIFFPLILLAKRMPLFFRRPKVIIKINCLVWLKLFDTCNNVSLARILFEIWLLSCSYHRKKVFCSIVFLILFPLPLLSFFFSSPVPSKKKMDKRMLVLPMIIMANYTLSLYSHQVYLSWWLLFIFLFMFRSKCTYICIVCFPSKKSVDCKNETFFYIFGYI